VTVDTPGERQQWAFDGRVVGADDTVLVIAEIGQNHNGSVALARELIDAARESGAHVAKFQMRHLPTLYGTAEGRVLDIGAQYVRDVVTQFELSVDEILDLMEYSTASGMSSLCTPFDLTSLTVLIESGATGIKLASADFTNHVMIREAIASGLPVLASTGMTAEGEVVGAIRLIRALADPNQVALLHCNSAYPAPNSDLNLRYIGRLRELSGMVVGYSGHERGIAPAIVAVSRGARIIEKHITLDHEMEGPDHRASLLPADFAALSRAIIEASESLGSGGPRVMSQGERMNRLALGKSLVATRDIAEGETIVEEMITARSPGVGLPPYRLADLVGHPTHRFIAAGEAFVHEDFSGWGPSHVEFSFHRPWGIPVRFHDYEGLLDRMWPDFLEFHLGRDDLDFEFGSDAPDLGGFGLKVHSPDVFANDHLLDLANHDPAYAAASTRWLQRVIDRARDWSSRFNAQPMPLIIASVGGFSPDVRMTADERLRAYDRLAANLARLDLDGVVLSMQTLPPFPWYFGGQLHCNLFVDPESTRAFAERVGHGVCLDISHTQMSCTYLNIALRDAIAELLPVVNHLHISDATGVSGEGVQIGEGDIDFADIAELLNRRAPEVPFIPEIWQGHLSRGAGFVEGLRRLEAFL
jgi:N-acetylneuraminate synthase